MAILHVYTSPVADATDTTRVRPQDWNSAHFLSQEFLGNTGGVSFITGDNIFWAAAGIASFFVNGNTVSISVPAGGGAGDGGNTIAAGGNTATFSGLLLFSNANGISFGLNAANGSVLTASHNGLTSQSNQAFSAAGGSSTFQTLSFNNANGATFSNVGGAIQLSYTVPSTAGLLSAVNVSAGTTSQNLSALTFNNANGFSFGLNGSVITGSYTVPSTAGLISAVNVSAGTTSQNLSALTFNNANGVTFGLNGSTLTASVAAQSVQTQGLIPAVSGTNSTGGGSSFQNSTMHLVQANGFSFIVSSNSISGSYTVPTQTAQTLGLYASSQTTGQSSSSTADARSLSIVGMGGVSVGLSNGSFLISGNNGGGAAFSAGISGGNTSGDTGTVSNQFVLAGGNNITVSGSTNAGGMTVTISGANVGGAQTGISGLANSQTTYTSGTVSFSELGAITIRSTTGQQFQFSVNPQSVQTQGLIPAVSGTNTAGVGSSFQNSTMHLIQANGFSFIVSGNSISGSYTVPSVPAQTNQTVGIYASSQTTGASSSSTADARSMSFVFSNNISGGWTNGSFLFNVTTAAQSNQTEGIYAVGNTTGQSSSSTHDARTLSVNGAGIASVGWSNGSFYVSATQSGQAFSAGGGSSAFQTLGFSDGGGVTFTNTNGSVGATVRTDYASSNHSHADTIFATGNTTQSSSGTIAQSSFIVRGDGGVSAGVTNGSVVISGPALTSLSVTGALSASSNGSTISLGVGTVTVSATSNTTQNSSGTVNLNGLIFQGAGAASVGLSNGSIVISAPNAGAGNVTISAGTTSAGLASIVFSNSNGVSFGLNGSTITASVAAGGGGGIGAGVSTMGNTAGSTGTVTTGNVVFVGSGAVSLSQSTGAAGSAATITINAPATSSLSGTGAISISTNGSTISIGVGTVTVSATGNTTQASSGTLNLNGLVVQGTGGVSVGVSNGSLVVSGATGGGGVTQQSFFLAMPANASTFVSQVGNGTVAVYPIMREGAFTATRADVYASVSVSSSSNSSHAGVLSVYVGLYTRNGSTLSLASSGSQSFQWTNTSNNSLASIASLRAFSVPINVNYSDGKDLWVAVMTRSSTTNANWFTASNVLQSSGIHSGQLVGLIGEASNATRGQLGFGRFSASSSVLPDSMGFSQITGGMGGTASASRLMPNVYFQNFTA